MLKKITGLLILCALAYACLFMIKKCQSQGSGSSPLAYFKDTNHKNLI